MRRTIWMMCAVAALALAAAAASGCHRDRDHDTSARAADTAAIVEHAWQAHEIVVAAGEHAPTCAEAGAAMRKAFDAQRKAFVDAVALDKDPARLREATAHVEAHPEAHRDLEAREEALAGRCPDDREVQTVFHLMDSPGDAP